ncbi:hypothetical protein ACOMHN_014513 [Nucella lapillus]
MIIPVLLILNGVLWLLPPLLVTLLNCLDRRYGTIYILVTVTQARSLDSLCTSPWLPPYVLCVLVADWLCFLAFYCLFCSHPALSQDRSSSAQFKHLKNLPPLASAPWNRHRALRKY